MEAVRERVRGIYNELEKQGGLYAIAADSAYDARVQDEYAFQTRTLPALERRVSEIHDAMSFEVKAASHRTVEATIAGENPVVKQGKENFGGELAKYLATRYATYKLAAVCAMQELNKDIDECTVALVAAQNLTRNQGD
jgi:hypothetical protein